MPDGTEPIPGAGGEQPQATPMTDAEALARTRAELAGTTDNTALKDALDKAHAENPLTNSGFFEQVLSAPSMEQDETTRALRERIEKYVADKTKGVDGHPLPPEAQDAQMAALRAESDARKRAILYELAFTDTPSAQLKTVAMEAVFTDTLLDAITRNDVSEKGFDAMTRLAKGPFEKPGKTRYQMSTWGPLDRDNLKVVEKPQGENPKPQPGPEQKPQGPSGGTGNV